MNEYHPQRNSDGVVNLGVAENKLTSSMLQRKMEMASLKVPMEMMGYHDSSGSRRLKDAVAGVLERHVFGARVDPEHLIISNGCTSTLTMLATCLSDGGKKGKKILYMAPHYPNFRGDLRGFAGVETIEVVSSRGAGTIPRLADLERVWSDDICALLLCHPDNPTGTIWSEQEMKAMIHWATVKGLYTISDEIYAASCHSPDPSRPFVSLYNQVDCTLWGLSKDFAASGTRCSVAYCREHHLLHAMRSFSYLYQLPNVAQIIFADILSDTEWVRQYLLHCNFISCLSKQFRR